MKLKILRNFTDKDSQRKYLVGEDVEFSDVRGKELLSDTRGLVELISDEFGDSTVESKGKKNKGNK